MRARNMYCTCTCMYVQYIYTTGSTIVCTCTCMYIHEILDKACSRTIIVASSAFSGLGLRDIFVPCQPTSKVVHIPSRHALKIGRSSSNQFDTRIEERDEEGTADKV